MKNLKVTAGILWCVGIVSFFSWDRANANGFWWTGFICLISVLAAGTLTTVFEKSWIRAFRVLSIVGIFLNGIVITFNGGRMPVIINDPNRAITGAWKVATSSDHFLWLCDRFQVGFGTCSIGDFFLFVSLFGILFLVKNVKKENNG